MGDVVFVVGTGTDVGKTHVTAALVSVAKERVRVAAWKPVASGGLEDAERLSDAAGEPMQRPLYALGRPVSPHLAAREEGVTIDVSEIASVAHELARGAEVLFVESAGGLYSPVSDRETNADVLRALGPETRVLLVAPDRLGVLHDVGAALRAARADGIVIDLVALSAPSSADASTGTNAEELKRLGLAREVLTFPRAPVAAPETRATALECFSLLSRRAAAPR